MKKALLVIGFMLFSAIGFSQSIVNPVGDSLPTQTGHAGQFLTTNGTAASWATPGGGGDVLGPGSSTDNAVVRWNGTSGTSVQNSGITISDTNDLVAPGTITIGPSGQTGVVSGSMRYVDTAWTLSDFTTTDSWRVDSARLIVDPDANYTSDIAVARFSQITIPNTNANNFGTLLGNTAIADYSGTGTLSQNVGSQSAARLAGVGIITTNVGNNVNVTGLSSGTGTITNNYGIVVNSGTQAATGTITNDYQIVLRTPFTTGTVSNVRGIYAEDHSAGGSGYFIYSAGGRSYHAGNLGLGITAPSLQLEVANDIQVTSSSTTGSYLHLVNTNSGGYDWRIRSNGSADSGGAGAFAISTFSDGTTPFIILPASNNAGFGTLAPTERLEVFGNEQIDGSLKVASIAQPSIFDVPTGSVQANPGNVDNGDHDIVVTFITAIGEETIGGITSGGITVADNTVAGQILWGSIPTSTNRAVTGRRLYRRFNGTGDYKLLTTINDNSTTSFLDNVANASLTTTLPTVNTTGGVYTAGPIGVGLSNPSEKLEVSGNIKNSGSITSTSTGSLGWSIVTGANTACSTTCTYACVHGWDLQGPGPVFSEVAVDCSDSSADKCLCAGAN